MKPTTNILLLMLFIILSACGEDDKVPEPEPQPFQRQQESLVMESQILHRDMKYSILFPEGYNESDKTYPVVYLLHGFGDNETSWMKGGNIRYYADRAVNSGIIEPVIFVAPQGFNNYYVNKYNGNYDYMKMFVEELVPYIDATYRTKADKSQRAVMGYSMGGYGAFILPSINPDVFSTAVALSMSWRTDNQYMAEPQGVFDSQFGGLFGGVGKSGTERITDYFKSLSPFHFFQQTNIDKYKQIRYYLDCGDDEEQLSITNDELHTLMRDKGIKHEYRMRNGFHTWDYWTGNMNEVFAFLQSSFASSVFPEEDKMQDIDTDNLKGTYTEVALKVLNTNGGVYLPPAYNTSGLRYSVIYFLHDRQSKDTKNSIKNVLALLEESFVVDGLPYPIVVEIPVSAISTTFSFSELVTDINENYRTISRKSARVLMANGEGGKYVKQAITETESCFLYNANIDFDNVALVGQFYYLDITDNAASHKSYGKLYARLRDGNIEHQYRVRNGTDSYPSFLNGLSSSFTYMNNYLITPEE
ncbi:MAG TPA: alpha/beta hydrolase-fold protein [Dysgonomonas sp.]|uniref:Esterase n=1 Tax=uncultured Dysgonomonas sp. TaxID=206096 RepID=A0A212J7H6_9BACT|nr:MULTISPECIES: alpha/beta hydrolase-fold protein [unclassified Dysgonomonas]SBV95366.1 conserved exported hypothetical protein [uncultured Dysgonomonas sp.]HML66009.1 alpha/beta hydrolase-fold protein [Dysgonomonas sp.]